ncbi:MAG: hypothetical protein AB2A00_35250 [Myxococcota bacterium]
MTRVRVLLLGMVLGGTAGCLQVAECTSDAECESGATCDTATNTCTSAQPGSTTTSTGGASSSASGTSATSGSTSSASSTSSSSSSSGVVVSSSSSLSSGTASASTSSASSSGAGTSSTTTTTTSTSSTSSGGVDAGPTCPASCGQLVPDGGVAAWRCEGGDGGLESCRVADCVAGRGNCDDGGVTCETDLYGDLANCGACNSVVAPERGAACVLGSPMCGSSPACDPSDAGTTCVAPS